MDETEAEIVRLIYSSPLDPSALEASIDLLEQRWAASYLMVATVDAKDGAQWSSYSHQARSISTAPFAEHLQRYQARHRETMLSVAATRPLEIVSASDYTITEEDRRVDAMIDAETFNVTGAAKRLGGAFGTRDRRLGFLAFGLPPEVDGTAMLGSSSPEALWLRHLEQASVHTTVFNTLRDNYQAVLSVLDRLLLGLVIIDSEFNVILKNSAASEVLESQAELQIRRGKLTGVHQGELAGLMAPNTSLVQRRAGTAFVFGTENAPERFACFADPLNVEPIELDHAVRGAVLVFIDTQDTRIRNLSLSQRVLGLTEAETECLEFLVQGDSYRAISEKRGVSPETTKSQVSSMLAKAGASRVNQLLVKIAKIDTPFDFS